MKRTCRASALLSAVTLFLPAVLLTAAVAPARADVSVSATAGNDNFLYNDLNFDVNVSSALDAGAYVARYSGNFVSRTELYAATLSWQERSAYASVSGYYSPETDDYLFYGGQVTGGFQGGTRDLDIDVSALFGRTLNILSGVPGAGRMPLHQNLLTPALNLSLRKTVTLWFSYSFYMYQEDQAAFFSAQFGSPSALSSVVYAVSGYPSKESQAGIAYDAGGNWRLSLEWDRLLFETLDVQQNSVIWSATYYASRSLGINAGYNLVDGTFAYYSLGLQWYGHGRGRGAGQKQGISYNNIP